MVQEDFSGEVVDRYYSKAVRLLFLQKLMAQGAMPWVDCIKVLKTIANREVTEDQFRSILQQLNSGLEVIDLKIRWMKHPVDEQHWVTVVQTIKHRVSDQHTALSSCFPNAKHLAFFRGLLHHLSQSMTLSNIMAKNINPQDFVPDTAIQQDGEGELRVQNVSMTSVECERCIDILCDQGWIMRFDVDLCIGARTYMELSDYMKSLDGTSPHVAQLWSTVLA